MPGRDPVVALVLELAERLLDDADVPDILTRICERCVDLFAVRGAGIVYAQEGALEPHTIAASDAIIAQLERQEIALDQGPCIAAWQAGQQVEEADVAAAGPARWPELTPFLLEQGVTAISSFPLVHQDRCVGSLNLFRSAPGPLGEEQVATARTLAGAATIYVLHSGLLRSSRQTIVQLQTALETRLVIEQAKGKLSQQLGVGVEDAFELLRHHARNHNLRLHDTARDVVEGRLRLGGEPA